MLSDLKPRPFNIDDPADVRRLLLESAGYLHTCRRDHHGTDFKGRQFAMEALRALADQQLRPDGQLRLPQATETPHE